MKKNFEEEALLPDEVIVSKIYLIRGKKVMLDRDLAELYKVETKQLKRADRRNIERFPDDFMFELSKEELENWRYQFGTSNIEKFGLRVTPFAFTEYGLLMLASVLNSERAIQNLSNANGSGLRQITAQQSIKKRVLNPLVS